MSVGRPVGVGGRVVRGLAGAALLACCGASFFVPGLLEGLFFLAANATGMILLGVAITGREAPAFDEPDPAGE